MCSDRQHHDAGTLVARRDSTGRFKDFEIEGNDD